MAALPDSPEALNQKLSSFAQATLEAIERGQDVPWLRADRSIDAGQLALVARGIQAMGKVEQETYFHRLGEAVADASSFTRQSTELLYHSTESLNAAAYVVTHPAAQDLGRDERLSDIPSHHLDNLHLVLAHALMQHARDLDSDTPHLRQDALLLFARDTNNGLGISDDALANAVIGTQATYFHGDGFTDLDDPRLLEPLRGADLTMATLQEFVQEPRFQRRFPSTTATDDVGDVQDSGPADAQDAPEATGPENESAAEAAESHEHHPSGQHGPDDPAGADTEPSPSETNQAQAETEAQHGETSSVEDGPPMPEDDGWIPDDDPTDSLFADAVLPEEFQTPAPTPIVHDHDWPSSSRRQQRGQRQRHRNKPELDHSQNNGAATPTPQGAVPPVNPNNPLGLPPAQPMPSPFPTNQNSGFPGGAGNGPMTVVNKGPGLFGGLAQVISSFRSQKTPKPVNTTVPPLAQQMAAIHERQAEQREIKRENLRLQDTYQQADQFVSGFNDRLTKFRDQSPVQSLLRQANDDQRRRQEAVRDGADPKIQQQRHEEWVEQNWEKLFLARPELRDQLRGLENDAQKIPERVKPALTALDLIDRDTSAEREALLSKVSRAKIAGEGLPASVPGKKKLGEVLGEIVTLLRNFIARLFGLREQETTPTAVPVEVVATSAPSQSARRRAGP